MQTKTKSLHPEARLPQYGYPGDAGMDLHVVGAHVLGPGESRDLPTGIAVELPVGHWGRITGRSSTLRKRGLFVNEGVIDEGYRGELLVYVTNRTHERANIESGDRLAQLIVAPVVQAPAEWATELTETARGARGFGSTGQNAHENGEALLASEISRSVPTAVVPRVEPTVYPGAVYLGGAVDVATDGMDNHRWRHEGWMVETYCPICSCKDLRYPPEIIKRNMRALDMAHDAVFVLDAFSVGTPIEAWHRIVARRKGAVIVWPHADASVFVTYFGLQPDVVIVRSVAEAADEVRARARMRFHEGT